MVFELKLAGGGKVRWEGADGEDAARRYADMFPGETVIAWRYPKTDLRVGFNPIAQ